MSTKIVNLSLPLELIALVDNQAKRYYATRSEYIKHAILIRLKSEGVVGETTRLRTLDELRNEQLKKFINDQEKQTT